MKTIAIALSVSALLLSGCMSMDTGPRKAETARHGPQQFHPADYIK